MTEIYNIDLPLSAAVDPPIDMRSAGLIDPFFIPFAQVLSDIDTYEKSKHLTHVLSKRPSKCIRATDLAIKPEYFAEVLFQNLIDWLRGTRDLNNSESEVESSDDDEDDCSRFDWYFRKNLMDDYKTK